MKFILWTLVWWGLVEISWWRIYYFCGVEYIDNNGTTAVTSIIMGFLFIFLYNYFIK